MPNPNRFGRPLIMLLMGWALLVASLAHGQERILHFKSSLVLQSNHTIDVTETITVLSSGINIKRGIYRNLSLDDVNLNYELLGVTRNGVEEPYSTERSTGLFSIRIDSKDLLIPGEHTYVILYRVYRKANSLNPFQWNVTGNWSFRMDKVEAEVSVAEGKLSGFSASLGGQANCNCSIESSDQQYNQIVLNEALEPGKELIIQLNWTTPQLSTISWESTERITTFKSALQVHDDRTLTVTESIRVRVNGMNIKRGIYRELLPQAELGGYEVLSVLRDGKPEHYQVENMGRKFMIRIGHENILLEPGVYEYLISYKVEREVHTRLDYFYVYWNVSGNDWKFPIDTVEAILTIPAKEFLSFEAYSGERGSKVCDGCSFEQLNDSTYRVNSVQTLPPGSGLTLLAKWKHDLKFSEVITSRLHDSIITLGWIIIIALMAYLLERSRRQVKADEQALQPKEINPEDYSPALLSTLASKYVITEHRMKALLSSLFNLSLKGYIEVDAGSSKRRSIIHAKENTEPVYEEDAELFKILFKEETSFEFSKRKSRKVSKAIRDFTFFMDTHYNMEQFIHNNYIKLLTPLLLYLFAALFTVLMHKGAERWMLFIPIVVPGLFPTLVESLRNMFLREKELFHKNNWWHIIWILFSLTLGIGVFFLFNYLDMAKPVNLVLFAAAAYLLAYYYYKMSTKTAEGMAVLKYIQDQGITANRLLKQTSFTEEDVSWMKNNLPFLQAYGIKPKEIDKKLGLLGQNLSAAMEEFYRTVRAASSISLSASSSSSGSSGGGGGGGGGGGW
ncbi:MAG: DUF2207 domain-containing protein [Cyclobacteriaceae bacterium]|nr:DUF2207 domain-containing protein [Cyclobacteriaceae bacterium]